MVICRISLFLQTAQYNVGVILLVGQVRRQLIIEGGTVIIIIIGILGSVWLIVQLLL